MSLDRDKKLQAAERLLKQGKVPAAMLELRRLADAAAGDLLTLNRIGDLLAKQNRAAEAIEFYRRIAQQFTSGGFLPKAVAIHKKILRLDAKNVDSLVRLGELYFQQKLPGEARAYLLRGAEMYLATREFSRAREVYEKLVAAEPQDPRHRARLAEAHAAEGETARAGSELLGLAESLLDAGKPAEAEQTFRRAAELLPDNDAAALGLARTLSAQGRDSEALDLLEKAEQRSGEVSPSVLGERIATLDRAGRVRDAMELMKLPAAAEIPIEILVRMFRAQLDAGGVDELWERFDPVWKRWDESGQARHIIKVLERLAAIEPKGHLPALQRLVEHGDHAEDSAALVGYTGRLLAAYESRGMEDEAAPLRERLAELGPAAASAAGTSSPAPDTAAARPSPAAFSAGRAGDAAARRAVPVEAEAPAVPLNRADEEFVAGRLTQGEILEKYGLHKQALEQVREVAAKFPGHVATQERLVQLLRETGDRDAQRGALVALALARRAAGDVAAARRASADALALGDPGAATRALLGGLGLLGGATTLVSSDRRAKPDVAAAEAAPAVARSTQAAPVKKAAQADSKPAAPTAPAPPARSAAVPAYSDDMVVIDFDAELEPPPEVESPPDDEPPPEVESPPEDEPSPAIEPPPEDEPSRPGAREPAREVIAEIEQFLADGDSVEATRRIEALETLGFSGARLSGLRARIDTMRPADLEAELLLGGFDDDDDLSAITAALESELFTGSGANVAVPEAEQTLEQVFAKFREQVAAEVGDDDFRTHYDLGIAYKGMGLIEQAIEEFRCSLKSPDLEGESYAMLALCYRDMDDPAEAARYYRQAIDSADDVSAEMMRSLRYDLAEVLLATGDRDGALDEFRSVLEGDPSYRDVRDRVADLESHSV